MKLYFHLVSLLKSSKHVNQDLCYKTHCTAQRDRKLCLWHLVCSYLMHQLAVMLHYLHRERTFRMQPHNVSKNISGMPPFYIQQKLLVRCFNHQAIQPRA